MLKSMLVAALMLGTVASSADAHRPQNRVDVHQAVMPLARVDRDGVLSAGWIDVLPVLAAACNLRIEPGQLTSRLIDLSHQDGNLFYTRDLYLTLYDIERHRTGNSFARAWTSRFDGRQDEACRTAEGLWGENGRQFPRVLRHDVAAEVPASNGQ